MKFLLLTVFLFISFATIAQTDTATYGYIDSVNIKNSQIPASFTGGSESWKMFLDKYLKYPKDAKKNKIEGDVILEFLVDLNGKVSNIKVIHSVYPSLDEEAIKIIQRSLWVPAVQDGQFVKYRKRQTISFHL